MYIIMERERYDAKKKKKKKEEFYEKRNVVRAPQQRQAPIALNSSLKQREMARRDVRKQSQIKDAQMEQEKRKMMAQRQMEQENRRQMVARNTQIQRQERMKQGQTMRVQPVSRGKKA